MIVEMGVPPDTNIAKKLCDEMNINIRFQSHNFNWTSSDYVPRLEELAKSIEFKDKYPFQEHFNMQFDDRPYSIFKTPKGVFIIQPINPKDFFHPERAIIILIILITTVIVFLYFIIRTLFKPLKILSGTVKAIGEGSYDIEIPIKRKDELGELADSIKEMSGKIKEHIKSKEQLLLDVSHELRSPLTRMKLALEVDAPKEKITEDINEMEKMITGLLESYRSESLFEKSNFEDTNLIELLNDTVSEYDVEGRVELEEIQDKMIFVKADKERLQWVFRNIINNALKYSSEKVVISVQYNTDEVIINFSDKGIGISKEDLKYIFEPFYRADSSRSKKTGGFGLGLSICKKVIEYHKGRIHINSEPGKGTSVEINLKKIKS